MRMSRVLQPRALATLAILVALAYVMYNVYVSSKATETSLDTVDAETAELVEDVKTFSELSAAGELSGDEANATATELNNKIDELLTLVKSLKESGDGETAAAASEYEKLLTALKELVKLSLQIRKKVDVVAGLPYTKVLNERRILAFATTLLSGSKEAENILKDLGIELERLDVSKLKPETASRIDEVEDSINVINETVSELKTLGEIAEKYPSDFSNATLAYSLFNELNKALEAGDYEKARKLAAELQQVLENLNSSATFDDFSKELSSAKIVKGPQLELVTGILSIAGNRERLSESYEALSKLILALDDGKVDINELSELASGTDPISQSITVSLVSRLAPNVNVWGDQYD